MKKFFTIYLYELKKIFGFGIIALVAGVLMGLIIISNMNTMTLANSNYVETFTGQMAQMFDNYMLLILIGVLMLVVIQFYDLRAGKVGEFLASLPCKKETFAFAKMLAGFTTIVIPWILSTLFFLCLHSEAHDSALKHYVHISEYEMIYNSDSAANVLGQMTNILLVALGVYFIAFFMQAVIHHRLLSVSIAFLSLMAPKAICMLFLDILSHGYIGEHVYEFFHTAGNVSLCFLRSCFRVWNFDTGYNNFLVDVSTSDSDTGIIFIFMTALIVIFAVSSFFVMKTEKHTMDNRIIPLMGIRIALFAIVEFIIVSFFVNICLQNDMTQILFSFFILLGISVAQGYIVLKKFGGGKK